MAQISIGCPIYNWESAKRSLVTLPRKIMDLNSVRDEQPPAKGAGSPRAVIGQRGREEK